MNTKGTIKLNNKKYDYNLIKKSRGIFHLECPSAKIDQDFLSEDLAGVLFDLPNLILAEKKYKGKQSEIVQFRVSPIDKKRIAKKAIDSGYNSVSVYARDLLLR